MLSHKINYTHIFCEITKIGYFLRDQYLADPDLNKLSVDHFLNSKLLDQYASKIDISVFDKQVLSDIEWVKDEI